MTFFFENNVFTGKIQTRVPHQAAALPARSVRQVQQESRAIPVGAFHHVVGVEKRIFHAHQPSELERGDGEFAEKGRAGNVRVQIGQDHVGQVRQPLGSRRTVLDVIN